MTQVFIDGGAGTTGLEIEARLAECADYDLIRLDSARRKDEVARREALNDADVVILCLPDAAARDAVVLIRNSQTRVIDASTAHRTAPNWTYGFPELGFDVEDSHRVSNPGCYATGFLALVAPLVRAGVVAADTRLTCNAVSGYSGGGKTMIAEFENDARPTALRTYALGLDHKHVPEMQHHAGLTYPPLFAPSVAATYRGMIVEIPLFNVDTGRVRDALGDAYADSLVVAVRDCHGDVLSIEHAAGTDRLDLFVQSNGDQTRLIAALDNLGKGAGGAAVQNLNLMCGVEQTSGLRL